MGSLTNIEVNGELSESFD